MKNNSFACSLKSDFYRLSKLKSVWIALALIFGLTLLSFAIYWFTLNFLPEMPDMTPQEIQQHIVLSSGRDLLYGSSSTISLGLFIAIITCIFIGDDFSGGYVATLTARGCSRANTYFSKWLTLVILSVAYVLFGLLVSGIFYSFTTHGTVFTAQDFAYLIRNLALQILCAISTVSIFVMIAFMARSTGASIAISLVSYILVGVIAGIISVVISAKYGENHSTDWMSFLPFEQMNIACTNGELTTTQTIAVSVMPIVYTAISTIIGYFTFDKKDIK